MGERLFEELSRSPAKPVSRRRALGLLARRENAHDPGAHFDAFAKALATPMSRSSALRALAGAVAVTLAGWGPRGAWAGTVRVGGDCPPSAKPCGVLCCHSSMTCYAKERIVPGAPPGVCCPQGKQWCRDHGSCCPLGTPCPTKPARFGGTCGTRTCPSGTRPCGSGCCKKGTRCCGSRCCSGRQKCCKNSKGVGRCCTPTNQVCLGGGTRTPVCCPTEPDLRLCDTLGNPKKLICCAKGQVCVGAGAGRRTCCPKSRACGGPSDGECCNPGETCWENEDPAGEFFCCPEDQLCDTPGNPAGLICCPQGQTCVGSGAGRRTCCPVAQACGGPSDGVCCPAGQTCVDPTTGTCA